MSKITLNATTFDLISTLSLDDIKLLEKQNPDALAIKDKDGDVQFIVKTGGTMGSISQYGIVFANKTRDGKAVLTYTLPRPSWTRSRPPPPPLSRMKRIARPPSSGN